MLSNCGQFEYSCSDGTCIPIGNKCDFVPDCWNGDDEKNCPILSLDNMEGYESDLPDIILDDAGNILKKPVKISIIIKDIESMK